MKNVRNLITIDGHRRYVWNSEFGHIMFNDGDVKRTFLLTERPYFCVESIKLSPMKNYIALCGPQGLTVLEVPKNWSSVYSTEDRKIYCKTFNVCDRLFQCDKRIRSLSFDWHPSGNETKQLICLLTNDNRLRICDPEDDSDHQVIFIKMPRAHGLDDGDYEDDMIANFSMLNLGESAVCFDFGPSIATSDRDTLWPVYILMGTGDIMLIHTSPINPSFAENVIGPLTMLPQAEDNYGSDASSMIVLDSSPPLIAIATPAGLIYHCFAFIDGQTFLPRQTLYVYECIEIAKDLVENPDDPFIQHRMALFKDPTSKLRYFCVHDNGIHTIVCPIIESLDLSKDIVEERESLSEFLICTRTSTPANAIEDDESSIARGIGVELKKTSMAVVVLMGNDEVIEQRISPATTLIKRRKVQRTNQSSALSEDILSASLIEASRADFEGQIEQILRRQVSIPMLRLTDENESEKNMNELILKTVSTVKVEYIEKFKIAMEAIKKKIQVLEVDIDNQMSEYKNALKDKDEMYASVIAVSNKTEMACKKQEEILSRLDHVLAEITFCDADSEPKRELHKLNEEIITYRKELDAIKCKHEYNTKNMEPNSSKISGQDVILSQTQLFGIKDVLAKQGAEIAELRRIVKIHANRSTD